MRSVKGGTRYRLLVNLFNFRFRIRIKLKHLKHLVKQVPHRRPVFGRERCYIETELVKFRGLALNLSRFRFVGSYENRLTYVSKVDRDLLIQRRNAGPGID